MLILCHNNHHTAMDSQASRYRAPLEVPRDIFQCSARSLLCRKMGEVHLGILLILKVLACEFLVNDGLYLAIVVLDVGRVEVGMGELDFVRFCSAVDFLNYRVFVPSVKWSSKA